MMMRSNWLFRLLKRVPRKVHILIRVVSTMPDTHLIRILEVIKAQSINGSLDVGDDARAFDACFRTQDIDVDTLEKLIHKHNYMPALCPPNNQEEEQLLWERLATLSQQNPGLAYEISQVCGVPSDITNYYVVSLSLDVTEYSNDSLEALIQSGFCLTTKIGSAFFYRHGADALVEQRRPFLVQKLQKDFQDCIESGLSDLLEEAAPDSLQRADAILTEFKLSEKAVERALRAPETDVESKSTPLLTKCAQAQAGMRDGLWQLLMGLYSPTHRLVSHCVADLVMAGTSKISPESLRGSVLFRRDSETSIAQSLKGSPSFDESLEETESRSRQSLSICIQSGVPLSCETFGLISKWIFQTQQVANRHLDYMIHVEKMILKILHLTSSNLTAHFLDESDKAVLFEWLASFFGNVLNSSDWIATLRIRRKSNQGVSVAEHGRLSFIQQSITDTMNGLMDPIILMSGQLGDLKRFYDAIQVLADRIETVCARPPPGDPGDELNEGRDVNDTGRSDENLDTLDSMESLPFREWLKSRETPPEPRSATVSSRASWISEFISK